MLRKIWAETPMDARIITLAIFVVISLLENPIIAVFWTASIFNSARIFTK